MNELSYAVCPEAPVAFDDAGMWADFVACTPAVDREGEVVLPAALDLTEYRRNPLWLWCHQKTEMPVGSAESPNGEFGVRLDGDRLLAKCWFSRANPDGSILYHLYRERTLRAVSVGYIPRAERKLGLAESREYGADHPVTLVSDASLLEISCCPVGMNPDALATAVSRAVLGGDRIPERLLLKLKAWLPAAAAVVAVPALPTDPPARQTTGGGNIPAPEDEPMSKTATATETTTGKGGEKPAAAAAATQTTAADPARAKADTGDKPAAKGKADDGMGGDAGDMATTDADVDTPDPHETVQAGIRQAAHDLLDQLLDGEIEVGEFESKLESYCEDHGKYGGEGEGDEEDKADDGDKKDDEDDDEDDKGTKAFVGELRQFMADVRAKLEIVDDLQQAVTQLIEAEE